MGLQMRIPKAHLALRSWTAAVFHLIRSVDIAELALGDGTGNHSKLLAEAANLLGKSIRWPETRDREPE